MVGGAGGWSTAARQPQPERCQLWRRRPLAARSGATARTSTQSAARGAALRRHGWHGHARCGACAGYGSSFFQVKSAYLTAKTPKISRLARRARGALRRLARLRRAGSQVYSFSDIGSKCFTYSEHHSAHIASAHRSSPTAAESVTPPIERLTGEGGPRASLLCRLGPSPTPTLRAVPPTLIQRRSLLRARVATRPSAQPPSGGPGAPHPTTPAVSQPHGGGWGALLRRTTFAAGATMVRAFVRPPADQEHGGSST